MFWTNSNSDTSIETVFISGWAFPCWAFNSDSPTLGFHGYDPYSLHETIPSVLKQHCKTPYRVVGFSMGALWLSHHSGLFPDATEFVCVGARPGYSEQAISPLLASLSDSPEKTLRHFYSLCHRTPVPVEPLLDWALTTSYLDSGLAYLLERRLSVFDTKVPVRFVHGKWDRVAPLKELKRWLLDTDRLQVDDGAGHVVSGI